LIAYTYIVLAYIYINPYRGIYLVTQLIRFVFAWHSGRAVNRSPVSVVSSARTSAQN